MAWPDQAHSKAEWCALFRLSYPELVHARESRWVLHLKIMPKGQVGHRPVSGKTSSEILQHAARQMEPKEVELILPNELVDLR